MKIENSVKNFSVIIYSAKREISQQWLAQKESDLKVRSCGEHFYQRYTIQNPFIS